MCVRVCVHVCAHVFVYAHTNMCQHTHTTLSLHTPYLHAIKCINAHAHTGGVHKNQKPCQTVKCTLRYLQPLLALSFSLFSCKPITTHLSKRCSPSVDLTRGGKSPSCNEGSSCAACVCVCVCVCVRVCVREKLWGDGGVIGGDGVFVFVSTRVYSFGQGVPVFF